VCVAAAYGMGFFQASSEVMLLVIGQYQYPYVTLAFYASAAYGMGFFQA
jgi:hypothetical protein